MNRKIELPNPLVTDHKPKILDFDLETVAAGFADPDWVPQKITCVAWSWIGSDRVESRICGPEGLFGSPLSRATMLLELLSRIAQADMVTGHNIERFDLPIINAECMRLDFEPIRRVKVQDTMKLIRSKGFKKGLDNLGLLMGAPADKMPLSWQGWQDAYEEIGWKTIRQRCESDVLLHKQTRVKLLEAGILKPPRFWSA